MIKRDKYNEVKSIKQVTKLTAEKYRKSSEIFLSLPHNGPLQKRQERYLSDKIVRKGCELENLLKIQKIKQGLYSQYLDFVPKKKEFKSPSHLKSYYYSKAVLLCPKCKIPLSPQTTFSKDVASYTLTYSCESCNFTHTREIKI